ncbi:hypothetical protein J4G37_00955 [Microvirga sp. 3-52]|nr:hypothetical protein [Microvirga sp. 3-52]
MHRGQVLALGQVTIIPADVITPSHVMAGPEPGYPSRTSAALQASGSPGQSR